MRSASYTYLSEDEWNERILKIDAVATSCQLCPRRCRVNRLIGEKGFCAAPAEMIISSIFPHHGEEPPISGENGSGTVFFSYCTLKCCFCQNYQISHEHEGKPCSIEEMAEKMLHLQKLGCHNINLVTATHFLPWVVKALKIAAKKGLNLPIVYNCGGYELSSTISLLSGIVDIYLPDMKYGVENAATEYSGAPDYVQINREAIREMFRQTGPLCLYSNGTAWRGLCIRHLVLPGNFESSRLICEFLCSVFDPEDISISLMAQYTPLYKANQFEPLRDTLSLESYSIIINQFISAGFSGYYQEFEQLDKSFLINFKSHKDKPLTGHSEE